VIKELVTITAEQWTDLCGMLDMPPQVSVADLEGAVHRLAKSCELQYQHVNELEAENKRLRDALKQIAYGASTNCGNCIDCNSINQIANEILDAPRA
jgi:hypothetical protein